jgi:hypothetical protein
MVNIATVALYATAVFGAVIRRDAATILADLQAIDNSTNTLTSTINSWDGSTVGAIGIATAANNVGDQVDTANEDAQGEVVQSSDDSATIITYIVNTGEPGIAASLDALAAREADFAIAGVASVVLSTLDSLKNKTDAYGASLLNITAADQQSAAQAVLTKLDGDFAAAIAAFS